jgi:hypothetical protein
VNPAATSRRTIPGPAKVVTTSPTFFSQSIREVKFKGLPQAGRDMGGFHSRRDTLRVVQDIPKGIR